MSKKILVPSLLVINLLMAPNAMAQLMPNVEQSGPQVSSVTAMDTSGNTMSASPNNVINPGFGMMGGINGIGGPIQPLPAPTPSPVNQANAASIAAGGNTTTKQTPTAAEQGVGVETVDYEGQYSDWLQASSPRQKGVQVNNPLPADVIADSAQDSAWLATWKSILLSKTEVPENKIDFEAKRLNKEEFAAWASRHIRYTDENIDQIK